MAGVVPINQLQHRMPEHGRIRYGVKAETSSGKQFPKAIDKWRFTSPDGDAIKQLAAIYGGRPVRWSDPKATPRNQFQVVTESNTIEVWLQPNSFDLSYELWGGKGIERRCDGSVCTFYSNGARVDDCSCAAKGETVCKPYSRVNLILPDIRFGGTWRLEVKGWTFAYEAPASIALIEELQRQGMSRCKLTLTERSRMTPKGAQQWIVPVFSLDATPVQITQGAARAGISTPTMPALSAGDDGITDAEIIDQY